MLVKGAPHMATNIALETDLLARAIEVSGEHSNDAVVIKALQEFIARRQQAGIAELMGTLRWDPLFDYKAERSRA